MNPISWWVCDQSSDQSCFSPAEWFHFCVLVIGAAGWSFVNPIRRLAATESLWETMRGRERAWGCVLGQGISVFHSLSGWFPERTGLSSPFLSLHTLTNILFFFQYHIYVWEYSECFSHLFYPLLSVLFPLCPLLCLTGSSPPVSNLCSPRNTSKLSLAELFSQFCSDLWIEMICPSSLIKTPVLLRMMY